MPAIPAPQRTIAFFGTATNYGDQAAGKELFNVHCAACHHVTYAHGSFRSVTERFGNTFFEHYVTAEDSLMEYENEGAKVLNAETKDKDQDHRHNYDLTDTEIKDILAFLRAYKQ